MVVPFASFATRQTPCPVPTPKAEKRKGAACQRDALRCCVLLVENNYTAQAAPCTASRWQAARNMKPTEIGSKLETITLNVSGMACGGCAANVTNALRALDGVVAAHVSHTEARAVITYDPARVSPQALAEAVQRAGYQVV